MNTPDNNIDSLIARYFDGNASEEEMAYILSWVKECDDNLQHFFKLRNIWYNVNPPFDMDDIDVEGAELKALEMAGLRGGRFAWIRRFFNVWSRVAAVLLIPVVAVAVYFALQTAGSDGRAREVRLATAFGCSMETELPDGSRVWMNANSSIAYPSDFGCDTRRVRLAGEAYFEVKSDKVNPFLVETHDLTVRATGTEFNVNAYPGFGSTSVMLASGVVNVTVEGQGYRLLPGENLSLNDGKVDVAKVDDMERVLAWREGRLIFDGETLEQLLARIKQIYNIEYTIADSSIATIPYRASFQGENISEIVRLLQISSPIICDLQEQPGANGPRYSLQVSKR